MPCQVFSEAETWQKKMFYIIDICNIVQYYSSYLSAYGDEGDKGDKKQ